jgi:DNA-binding IclR family transcriptional regulator
MSQPPDTETPAIYEDTLQDKQFATTLARGLEILKCFTPEMPVLGNKELSARTGLPRATISRFTYTLQRLGYLRMAPHQQKFQLGSAVLSLVHPLLANMYIRQLARPIMLQLAEEVGGSVALGVRDRLNIVYVEAARSQAIYAPPYTETGYAHPIAATSIGRAYLAGCDQRTRAMIINEIQVKTPDVWKRYKSSVERALDDFLRLGFCVSSDFFRSNILGVGAPLRRTIDGEIYVMNCAVYADSVSVSQLEKSVGPKLLAVARRVENCIRG